MARRPFRRTDRLGSQIKEVLAVLLAREARDPLLVQVVLTAVEVTRDLSVARVFYYLADPARQAELALSLERATGFLRRRLGEEIRARIVPELRFIYDTSIDHGRRIEEILATLPRDAPSPSEASSNDDPEPSMDR